MNTIQHIKQQRTRSFWTIIFNSTRFCRVQTVQHICAIRASIPRTCRWLATSAWRRQVTTVLARRQVYVQRHATLCDKSRSVSTQWLLLIDNNKNPICGVFLFSYQIVRPNFLFHASFVRIRGKEQRSRLSISWNYFFSFLSVFALWWVCFPLVTRTHEQDSTRYSTSGLLFSDQTDKYVLSSCCCCCGTF